MLVEHLLGFVAYTVCAVKCCQYYFCFLNSFWKTCPYKKENETWTCPFEKGAVPSQTKTCSLKKLSNFSCAVLPCHFGNYPYHLELLFVEQVALATAIKTKNKPRWTWNLRTKICLRLRSWISMKMLWGLGSAGAIKLPIIWGIKNNKMSGNFERFPLLQCVAWLLGLVT